MFVRKSKYEEVVNKLERIEFDRGFEIMRYNGLVEDYNRLVRWIKKRGGVDVIDQAIAIARQPASTFTNDEIKTLIRLCHPDKHNGSVAANSITTKLLKMRK